MKDRENTDTHIVIIGSGPGGYVAALKAAILGAKVTLVEKERIGGVCLNRGCIPTKALLSSSKALKTVKRSAQFGISVEGRVTPQFDQVAMRKQQKVDQLVQGIGYLLQKRGVQLVEGFGRLANPKEVEVELNAGGSLTLKADRIILATGSTPVALPMLKHDGSTVITSDEALNLTEVPKSILIVGGGVIGCEFGQFFRKMGVEVTIVEMAHHLLPNEDEDVGEGIGFTFQQEGIRVLTGQKVTSLEHEDGIAKVVMDSGEVLAVEKVLVSIGRKANTTGLGLENASIEVSNGKIVVDDRMETGEKGIYAIGDIVDTPFLAHVASREAEVAVENILRETCQMQYHAVPRCIYTDPQIAAVGMTERQAKSKGIAYNTGQFSFSGLGKAHIEEQLEGRFKILTDAEDKIIGASIIGAHATDLLAELTLAVHLGLTAKQMGEVIHPHPTLSEGIMEALHDVHNESVHAM